jgi:hypothetical protein
VPSIRAIGPIVLSPVASDACGGRGHSRSASFHPHPAAQTGSHPPHTGEGGLLAPCAR